MYRKIRLFFLSLICILKLTLSRSNLVCYEVENDKVYIEHYFQMCPVDKNTKPKGGVFLDGIRTNYTKIELTIGFGFKENTDNCLKCEDSNYYYQDGRQVAEIFGLKNGWHSISFTDEDGWPHYDHFCCHHKSDFYRIFIDGINGVFLCEVTRPITDIKCPKEIIVPSTNPANCEGIIPDILKVSEWEACKPTITQNIDNGSFFYVEKDVTISGHDDYGNLRECKTKVKQDSGYFDVSRLMVNKKNIWPANNLFHEVEISGIDFTCDSLKLSCSIDIETNDAIDNGVANAEDYEITGELSVKLRARNNKNGTNREYIINLTCSSLRFTSHNRISVFVEKESNKKNNGLKRQNDVELCDLEKPIFIDNIDELNVCDKDRIVPDIVCPTEYVVESTDPSSCQGIIPDISKIASWSSCNGVFSQNIHSGTPFYGSEEVVLSGVDQYSNYKYCTTKIYQDSGKFIYKDLNPSQETIPQDNKMHQITFDEVEFSCPIFKIACELSVITNESFNEQNNDDFEIIDSFSIMLKGKKNKDGTRREYVIISTCSALGDIYRRQVTIHVK